MRINWNELTVMNEKREVKRFNNLHSMRSGLVLYIAQYYEKLNQEKS